MEPTGRTAIRTGAGWMLERVIAARFKLGIAGSIEEM